MSQSQFSTQLPPTWDPSTTAGFHTTQEFYASAVFHQEHFLFCRTQYDWPPSVQEASPAVEHTITQELYTTT